MTNEKHIKGIEQCGELNSVEADNVQKKQLTDRLSECISTQVTVIRAAQV